MQRQNISKIGLSLLFVAAQIAAGAADQTANDTHEQGVVIAQQNGHGRPMIHRYSGENPGRLKRYAQSSARIDKLIVDMPTVTVFNETYHNPGLRTISPDSFNHGALRGEYSHKERENFRLQSQGTSTTDYSVFSHGVQRVGNKVFWGSLGYNNGVRYHVGRTSTIENDLIGPYVVADSVYGNFFGEAYNAKGGFAIDVNKWSFGGELGYSASNAFRKIDPRPRATTTSAYLKLSLGRDLGSKYRIGLSVEGSNYLQSLNVKVYQTIPTTANPNKDYPFYAMRGFGLYNMKALPSRASYLLWTYDGLGYGAGLFLAPKENGFIVSTNYKMHQTVSDLDDNNEPFKYSLTTISNTVGWKKVDAPTKLFFRLNYDYGKGIGQERVIITETQSNGLPNYIQAHKADLYVKETHDASFSGTIQFSSSETTFWVSLGGGFESYAERYLYPKYHMEFSHAKIDSEGGAIWKLNNKSNLITRLGTCAMVFLESSMILPENNPIFEVAYRPDIEIREGSYFGLMPGVTYLRNVGGDRSMIEISAKGTTFFTSNKTIYSYGGSVGFRF